VTNLKGLRQRKRWDVRVTPGGDAPTCRVRTEYRRNNNNEERLVPAHCTSDPRLVVHQS
jgi:hypothetical protein